MDNIYKDRVEQLRSMMRQNGWDAVIISGSDPHSSEYPAPRWQQVRFLSGFTGEAGDLVISLDHAGLWTDSRYFIQATKQLEGAGIELHRLNVPGSPDMKQWLASQGWGPDFTIAFDGLCQPLDFIQDLQQTLTDVYSEDTFRLEDVPDMLGALWEDRPLIPQTPIITLDEETVGMSRSEKIAWLRNEFAARGCTSMLLSSLDEIAWLLNVRGNDIEYNPLVISYLYLTETRVQWLVKKADALEAEDIETLDSFESLEADGIEICYYEELESLLFADEDDIILIDPSSLNYNTYIKVLYEFGPMCIVEDRSPVPLKKAVKTAREIDGMHEAYLEDGVAMEKFLYWLEKAVADGEEVTEWDASERLTSFRAEIPGYMGNSFENISAYGPSAALPHYSTHKENSPLIRPYGLYLVDSGGQYLFGTTDITRTVPMGPCTELEKEDYTLVLKGMIALSMAVFPYGTAGCQLDVLARNPLWRRARNYGHGTGHGIGFFLCVHEGPQSIRQNFLSQPLLPGMFTSNEPAIYREGKYGIRHENIILCREKEKNSFGHWLEFETMTLTHFDTSAIIPSLLAPEELEWLNNYNERVYLTLAPLLEPEIASWLRRKTLPLSI